MDYKQMAMEELKRYPRRVEAVENLGERIEVLQVEFESARTARADRIPVKGGASRAEARLINNIAERQQLEENLMLTRRLVKLVERGLGALEEEERRVLRGLADGGRGSAERLALDLAVDRATVYRLREAALKKFTLAMYGVEEL